jgi:vacuolar-type H+-ATPase subunit F/Vma7
MDFFVLGGSEIVTGFALAGVKGKACTTREEALSAFRELTEGPEGCKVLILDDEASSLIPEELRDWQLSGEYPLIVEIPAFSGTAAGKKSMVDSIREAIGIHI